jgi:nitrite reductase (cytochrome c-552)
LKAQHPEFEMWNQGIHARSGVACADCHMPYQRTGAMKISDHHVRSPLLNVNRACQTCHRWSEDELRARVHTIQDRTYQVRNIAMDALIALITDIRTARDRGADDAALEAARRHQRRAQFLLDFIEAENSMGFHADQEAVRVLALSLDETRRGQAALPGATATPGAQTRTPAPPQVVSPGRAPGGG